MEVQQNKNIPASLATLMGRLAFCAEKIGGKRPLAAAGGISEAQLFRYLSGESDIPSERLVGLAKAAGVAPEWLLTGHGEPDAALAKTQRPPFKPELLQRVAQVLDEVLVEYPHRLTPRLKSHFLMFLYDAIRHEELRTRVDWNASRTNLVMCLDYLTPLKDEETLTLFKYFQDILLAGKEFQLSAGEADNLVQTLTNSISSRYNGPSGEVDFRQMTQTVREVGRLRLISMMETLALQTKCVPSSLHFLDIGCGNGRDLAFLQELLPQAHFHGVDISKLAVGLCQRLEQSGKLPSGNVKLADYHALPYPSVMFDGAQGRLSLPYTPWLPLQKETGILKALRDIHRVIKPGGLFFGHFLLGKGHILLPFMQLYEKEDLAEIGRQCGFEMIDWKEHRPQEVLCQYGSQQKLEPYFQRVGMGIFRRT